MAGVGDSMVVSRGGGLEDDLLALGTGEKSLQELIDSELALRIAKANQSDEEGTDMANATLDFLQAEARHASLCLMNGTNSTNPSPQDTDTDNDWTTVEEVVTLMKTTSGKREINDNDVIFTELSETNTTNNVCVNNNYNHVSISETHTKTNKTSELIVETKTITTTKTIVDDSQIISSNTQETVDTITQNGEIIDITDSNHIHSSITDNNHITISENHIVSLNDEEIHDNHETHQLIEDSEKNGHMDQVDRHVTNNHEDVIVSQDTNHIVISEDVKETKSKKKKSTIENGETVTTKTKKKKSKKSDEKENHISVIPNGHDYNDTGPLSPTQNCIKQDELVNVNVKTLTQSYVNEATKCFNSPVKSSEEPVAPSVPIRELRRSFGDIHKACENNDLSYDLDDKQLRARSLGDLSKIEKQPVITGVNVKQLASFWRTISIENISTSSRPSPSKLEKSSFSKFDQLSKKTILHVRSSDPAKAQKTFSQGGDGENPSCKACGKTVFVMEQIKAERAVWHKNCFRCHTCNKQLTIDIYSSHEGELYCKPHFRELFTPKAVVETEEPVRRRKPEMIIRENQPIELPPDVVRASDKPDLGLEELSSLNVKSKFQVFERGDSNADEDKGPTKVEVKRSSSILSKLAKFQKRGMDVGVTDKDLDGFVYEESSSEGEEEEEDDDEETGVIKCRKIKEKPMSFGKMDDVKKNWESGATRKEEMLEQKKQDLQHLRSRLFMGKQVKMKEMYEQAVAECEGKLVRKESDIIKSDKAKAFREKFEKGEVTHSDEEEDDKNKSVNEDMSVFEEGISKKSRSIFLEMDAKTQSTPPQVHSMPAKEPVKKTAREVYMSKRQLSDDIVRSSDKVEEVTAETADISSKFKFFEKYKAPEKEKRAFRITPPREGQVKTDSPEREVYRDPTVVRSEDKVEEDELVKRSQTASKMLSIFRQMEDQKPNVPDGPKPKKEFTPPPDYRGVSSSEDESEEESEEEESEDEISGDGVVKSSHKIKDEFLEGSKMAARAKDIAAKFESWEPEKQSGNNAVAMLDSEQPSLESTKSLRAHFESLKNQKNESEGTNRPRVNRFVEAPTTICSSCESKVYPLEKIETDGKIFHKQCFRCSHCNCILRMDSYTLNAGHLYCLAHFKQLFISKGNYDEGFGVDQHKRKWEINGTPA